MAEISVALSTYKLTAAPSWATGSTASHRPLSGTGHYLPDQISADSTASLSRVPARCAVLTTSTLDGGRLGAMGCSPQPRRLNVADDDAVRGISRCCAPGGFFWEQGGHGRRQSLCHVRRPEGPAESRVATAQGASRQILPALCEAWLSGLPLQNPTVMMPMPATRLATFSA